MGIILDTSAIIAVERAHESLDALVAGREDEPFGISVVTAAELLHGVERADTEERKLRRQAFVEKVIDSFPIFPFDLTVGRIYARIWAAIARNGWTVGAHDLSSLRPPPFRWTTPSPRSTSGILRRSRGSSWKNCNSHDRARFIRIKRTFQAVPPE